MSFPLVNAVKEGKATTKCMRGFFHLGFGNLINFKTFFPLPPPYLLFTSTSSFFILLCDLLRTHALGSSLAKLNYRHVKVLAEMDAFRISCHTLEFLTVCDVCALLVLGQNYKNAANSIWKPHKNLEVLQPSHFQDSPKSISKCTADDVTRSEVGVRKNHQDHTILLTKSVCSTIASKWGSYHMLTHAYPHTGFHREADTSTNICDK